jgi:NDP-sugar pyrophosphorylase family protein
MKEDTHLDKKLKTSELFHNVPDYLYELTAECEYPWEMLKNIELIIHTAKKYERFSEISEGIFVGRGVKISDKATLIPPLLIDDECEIRPSAYLRGKVIVGTRSIIGNASEVKNSILLSGVQLPHYNYVGDSVIGNRAHLGAGAICSNLKSDKSYVTVRASVNYPTGLRKLGAMLGDDVEVGCGAVLNPGTVIGKGSRIYPLCSLRGVYPEACIIKDRSQIVRIK